MDNKEYRNNQKEQRSLFKKYRKSMWKMFIAFLFAGASLFVLPEYVFSLLNKFLSQFLSEYLAGSITVFTQFACILVGALSGVINAFKAIKAKDDIDKAQDKEETIVDSLIEENDKLKEKVEDLKEEKTKLIEENKTNTETYNYHKSSDSYTEEKQKVKKYTR